MKFIVKIIILIAILINPFNTEVTSQIEDHYHSFNGVMYVPIIVDHQEEFIFNDGRKKENNIPDKKISFQVNMNAKDMRVKKGVFSGVIVKNIGSVGDEVITYKGKASKDKQVLEYIEITQEKTIFRMSTRENVEKTISLVARFENIPKSPYGGGYKFKYGVSKIASVSYNEEYTIPRYGFVNNYTENFVKIDEEKIGKYYSGVRADFKPGVLKLELKNDIKITVIPDGKEMLAVGVHALMISELMKIPGLKVLEGYKTEKLLDEIKLSQSGLVSEETAVRAGRIMTPDVEIHLLAENRVPEDVNLRIQSVTLRSKIKVVETGQIFDPSLTYHFDLEQVKREKNFFEIIDAYIEHVVAFAAHFLYE